MELALSPRTRYQWQVQAQDENRRVITSQVQTMIKKTRNSVTTIEQNSISIDEACNSFQKIYSEIENTNQIVQEMMKQISTVSDVASNMAAVSE